MFRGKKSREPQHIGASLVKWIPQFPYYNGAPTAISTAQWLFVLAIVTGNRPRFGAHHRMTTHHNLPMKG
jgi:hypothetical protein